MPKEVVIYNGKHYVAVRENDWTSIKKADDSYTLCHFRGRIPGLTDAKGNGVYIDCVSGTPFKRRWELSTLVISDTKRQLRDFDIPE